MWVGTTNLQQWQMGCELRVFATQPVLLYSFQPSVVVRLHSEMRLTWDSTFGVWFNFFTASPVNTSTSVANKSPSFMVATSLTELWPCFWRCTLIHKVKVWVSVSDWVDQFCYHCLRLLSYGLIATTHPRVISFLVILRVVFSVTRFFESDALFEY